VTGMAGERDPWVAHRRRAGVLRTRHGFAAEVMRLYVAVAGVWAYTWERARTERPTDLAGWAHERVLPEILAVTVESGPAALAQMVADTDVDLGEWLRGQDLPPVERYLARASLTPVVAALGWPAESSGHCPHCGGLPQLSSRSAASDPLVSEPRRLLCSRCAQTWNHSRSSCPYCGETEGAKRTVYAEENGDRFPHLSLEACHSCDRYLIEVDLRRDRDAVPDVDELAALPLVIYAAENGLTKITPNIMGL